MTLISEPPVSLPDSWRLSRRSLLALAVYPALSTANPHAGHVDKAQSATNLVADFNETSWAALLQQGPRPAAYVFTTTYCASCPEAFGKLSAFIKASRRQVTLAAVVMDVSADRVLSHAHHYVGATHFYAFDGFAPAIRQSVDPKWPNVTPYVVLLGRDARVQRSIGAPPAAMLKNWLI